MTNVREGKISFLAPAPQYDEAKNILTTPHVEVFYNPRMEFNRDFAVLFLDALGQTSQRPLRVCEPFTGCGVRGMRFAVEPANVERVVINDLSPTAAKLAEINVRRGIFDARIHVENKDANRLLSEYASPGTRFDFIDIDPYGSPAPFIDSALRALNRGGVLAVTATDMAPLCGVHTQTCVRRYGVTPLRTEYCHEVAVRVLAGFVSMAASRYDFSAEPIFCHAADHYVRVYTKVRGGASKTESTLRKLGYVSHCRQCYSRTVTLGRFLKANETCASCGAKTDFGGPIWLGELWDSDLCESMSRGLTRMTFGQSRRLTRTLQTILREHKGPATFFVVSHICDMLGIPVPKLANVLRELRKAGFFASETHFHGQGLRTDCPAIELKETLLSLNR